jgi:hypothetical protein
MIISDANPSNTPSATGTISAQLAPSLSTVNAGPIGTRLSMGLGDHISNLMRKLLYAGLFELPVMMCL